MTKNQSNKVLKETKPVCFNIAIGSTRIAKALIKCRLRMRLIESEGIVNHGSFLAIFSLKY